MEIDIDRKSVLIGLFDWLYQTFGDETPDLIKLPVKLALCIALRADESGLDALKKATRADVKAAIEASKMNTTLIQVVSDQTAFLNQLVSNLNRVSQQSFVEIKDELDEQRVLAWSTFHKVSELPSVIQKLLDEHKVDQSRDEITRRTRAKEESGALDSSGKQQEFELDKIPKKIRVRLRTLLEDAKRLKARSDQGFNSDKKVDKYSNEGLRILSCIEEDLCDYQPQFETFNETMAELIAMPKTVQSTQTLQRLSGQIVFAIEETLG